MVVMTIARCSRMDSVSSAYGRIWYCATQRVPPGCRSKSKSHLRDPPDAEATARESHPSVLRAGLPTTPFGFGLFLPDMNAAQKTAPLGQTFRRPGELSICEHAATRHGCTASIASRTLLEFDREAIATGKTDAMTAGGQMTARGHNEELPPVTFRIDIPVMAVRVSGSNPSRTGAWRHFPPTCLPSVGVAIPAVISPNPDVIPAWTKGAMLPNANRRPKPDNDLRMSRYQP
jgi:hypothetical protein